MATANLYITKSDRRKADKDISNVVKSDVSITYKDGTETVRPTVFLNYDNKELMKKVNYVYLSDKDRYYFVEKAEFVAGQKVRFEIFEDVRMSWKNGIRKLTCNVDRNENEKNGYLHDNNYSVYSYEQIVCKMYPNAINQDSIILMTVG